MTKNYKAVKVKTSNDVSHSAGKSKRLCPTDLNKIEKPYPTVWAKSSINTHSWRSLSTCSSTIVCIG